jgi:hypothetical protein
MCSAGKQEAESRRGTSIAALAGIGGRHENYFTAVVDFIEKAIQVKSVTDILFPELEFR